MHSLLTIPEADYFHDLSFLQSIIDSIEEGVVVQNRVCLQLQDSVVQEQAEIIKHLQVRSIHYPRIYLQSILYNLISNSLKYHPKGVIPLIRISTFSKAGQLYLSVADNGLGIDMKRFGSSLFKFQKSFHNGYDSKGIGLYMIRNQVEDLGGSISVESEVDKGTTFTVRF